MKQLPATRRVCRHEQRPVKILIVTNLYPPHHIGGYELGCRDVVEKLRLRGHAVHVLASTHGVENSPGVDASGVERILRMNEGASTGVGSGKREECRKFAGVVKKFRPDIVYFWNQAGLCLWLPVYARWLGCRMAFFLSDTNFVSWRVGAFLRRFSAGECRAAIGRTLVRGIFGKTFLVRGYPVIRDQTCHFASHFLKNRAVAGGMGAAPNSIVAHWGIEPGLFTVAPRERWPLRKLLYAGQLIPQKGVHTAIATVALLAREPGFESLSLDIAGGGMHPDYEKKLRAMAAEPGMGDRVHFLGRVPRDQIAGVYREHDVLVFPSEWDEPFAITPLEAITAGMAVVGTVTGGSGELFRDRETAMVFEAGNAQACAEAIRQLATDRELFETIRTNAAREVAAHHTLDAMVNAIEKSLMRL